jgi:protein-S-isoprenylcysteine O-methyltransferase Ste14
MDRFHTTFVVLASIAATIRVYFRYRARSWPGTNRQESPFVWISRFCVGPPLLLVIIVYVFRSDLVSRASVAIPPVLRWLGALLFAAALPLLVWIQVSLGANYSPSLRIRREHDLTTAGPYRYVRHPMYATSLLIYGAMGLLSANWLIGGLGVLATLVVMVFRAPREEAMMVSTFGDRYVRYAAGTGRFLPRWPRRQEVKQAPTK